MTSQVSHIKTHQHLFSSRGLSEIDLKWQLQLSQITLGSFALLFAALLLAHGGSLLLKMLFPHRCDSRLQVLNYRSTLFLYVHQSSSPESSACNYRHTEAPSVSLVFNVGGKKIFKYFINKLWSPYWAYSALCKFPVVYTISVDVHTKYVKT